MTRSSPLPALILALALVAAPAAHAAGKGGPRTAAGWTVTPAGKQFGVAPDASGFQGPLASALSPGATRLIAVSSGASRSNSADLFDMRRGRRLHHVEYDARRGGGEAVFYGVAFSPDGRRAWASGGGQDVVHSYAVGTNLRELATIPVPSFPAGLAYGSTPHGDRLYVANNLAGRAGDTNPPGHTVTVIDPATNAVVRVIDLGMAAQPLGVTFDRTGKKAYVTQWLGRSVSVIDTTTETALRNVTLSPASDPLQADHPSAIAANPRRDEVYTANSNSDTVSVIDTRSDAVVATIDVSLASGAREGAMPDGMTVSPEGKRLYVALAGENALAVINVARRRVIGFIPTA